MFLLSTILWILLGKLRGGSFERLSQAEFRRTWVIFGVLALRFALYSKMVTLPPGVPGLVHSLLFLSLMWALMGNLNIPGMNLALAGTIGNIAVIAANGGRMPVDGAALRAAGLWETTGAALSQGKVLTHQLAGETTRLWFLGDVMSLRWPWGAGVVYSAGDLLLIAGMFFAIQALMGVPSGEDSGAGERRARPAGVS